jgi:hypothetical protein
MPVGAEESAGLAAPDDAKNGVVAASMIAAPIDNFFLLRMTKLLLAKEWRCL